MTATTAATSTADAVPTSRILHWLVVGGAVWLTVQRLWLGLDLPLWIDETWTAVIVKQTSWAAFWREAWLDCNPPLYYLVTALWTDIAGLSNLALRTPSFIFVLLAAAMPLLWRMPGLTKQASITWAALILFWWPAGALAVDARAYALVFLISTAQAIAFGRLLQSPSHARAAMWALLGSLAILTHLYAVFLVAVQGLIYLHHHRLDAIRTWPAALAFVPAFAWIAAHLPRLRDYARPDVAWYGSLGPGDLVELITYLFGATNWLFFLLGVGGLVASLIAMRGSPRPVRDEPETGNDHLVKVAIASALAFALIILIALVKPTLTPRYLTPLVPALMLGLVLIARHIYGTHAAYAGLAAIFLGGAILPHWLETRLAARSLYGYEDASTLLAAAHPDHVVFAWDHPAAKILDRGSLRQMAGFFFERQGLTVPTTEVVLSINEDPNRRLVTEARGQRPAIIWLYNTARQSAARDFPPRIGDLPGWRCTHRRDAARGIVACAFAGQPRAAPLP